MIRNVGQETHRKDSTANAVFRLLDDSKQWPQSISSTVYGHKRSELSEAGDQDYC